MDTGNFTGMENTDMSTENSDEIDTEVQDMDKLADNVTSVVASGMENVVAALAMAREEAARLTSDLDRLQEQLRVARGTGDVSEQAKQAKEKSPKETPDAFPLPTRKRQSNHDIHSAIEAALSKESLGIAQLARVIGEPVARVGGVIRGLRDTGQVHNVGSIDHPLWSWRPGDNAQASELVALVRRLISERPMTTRELIEATGARPSRVSGAIVSIQRSSDKIRDMGSPRLARWFLLTEGRDARLGPKNRV